MSKIILATGRDVDLTALLELGEILLTCQARHTELRNEAHAVIAQLRAMEAQGVDFGRPHYQGRYLYRRTQNSTEYVGNKPEKTAPALASMHRGHEYRKSVGKLREIIKTSHMAHGAAHRLLRLLKKEE